MIIKVYWDSNVLSFWFLSLGSALIAIKALYHVFYIEMCPGNLVNLVGKATIIYSEQKNIKL